MGLRPRQRSHHQTSLQHHHLEIYSSLRYGPHHGGIYETMAKATKRAFHTLYVEEDLNMDKFRTAVS